MPFNGEKQCVGEDQPSDSDSSRFSESMASLSDYECSRQSFTSDSSSKSSSPASTSPPRVVTFDEVMAAARNLSNMTLAHEIAVNENFQLKQDALPENRSPEGVYSPPRQNGVKGAAASGALAHSGRGEGGVRRRRGEPVAAEAGVTLHQPDVAPAGVTLHQTAHTSCGALTPSGCVHAANPSPLPAIRPKPEPQLPAPARPGGGAEKPLGLVSAGWHRFSVREPLRFALRTPVAALSSVAPKLPPLCHPQSLPAKGLPSAWKSFLLHSSLPLVQVLLSFLTPGGNRLRNQICEVLDTDLIRQQAEHSAVDIQGLANYVISTMGKLCAPVRDDDIRELKATCNTVDVLRQIFHVLDLMKMDMVNFTIRSLRPHLQRQLVDYERTKFQEILEETPNMSKLMLSNDLPKDRAAQLRSSGAGTGSQDKYVAFALAGALDQTTEWIKESVHEELLSLSETALTPGAKNSSKPSLSPTLVLNNSYLKLLQWDYQKKELPQELTGKLNQLKMIACLSLITNNIVGAITEGLPELAVRLKRIAAVLLEGMNKETFNLKEVLNSIGVQTCVEVNKTLMERGLPALDAEVQANLVGQFSSIEEEDNPIWSLIDQQSNPNQLAVCSQKVDTGFAGSSPE
ncbi:hypothetical protein J1605_020324 [Eschrichtius robustus]|uniref:T-complex protein 11-like protein 2 n=2 Tax=Boreoeutheria TaxID=1437010 RepID=A0AB34HKE3_ESCRO|nr:hypothetical protein J1605_020324 [Eschrichtius robustus]